MLLRTIRKKRNTSVLNKIEIAKLGRREVINCKTFMEAARIHQLMKDNYLIKGTNFVYGTLEWYGNNTCYSICDGEVCDATNFNIRGYIVYDSREF